MRLSCFVYKRSIYCHTSNKFAVQLFFVAFSTIQNICYHKAEILKTKFYGMKLLINLAFQNLHLPQIESKDSLDTKTQSINFEQGLFEGVFEKVDARMDLPKIREHYVFKGSSSTLAEPIIMLQNGQSLLSQYSLGKGKVYLFSIASNDQFSNFIKHALFVPTIIKIGVLSLKPISLYYQTSANQSIEMNSEIAYKDKPLHISKINSTIDLIPEQKVINNKTMLFTQNQIAEAGHYLVSQVTNTISGIAFNFNRKESDMNFYSKFI